jgi:tetratricopeptide (TPR) repeat protein
MADVLRMQGKSAKDIARYLDKAKANAKDDKELARSIALCQALVSVRDGKLDDGAKALAAIDAAGDNRVAFETALVAFMQNKVADAKPIVEQILATSADHDAARALSKKLETAVAKSDPLPPEDGQHKATPTPQNNGGNGGGGGDYDSLLAKANKLAESNCQKAMELYGKALEQKPTGVEALTGMGYCYLDAKQFASAFSKFRAALAVSPRFEPALGGVAETYQRQGNKEQAIAAWHNYLDVIPNSPKAKKQLEILGDSGGDKPAPPPQGSAESAPAPAPAPQAAAGSGSAS